MSLAYLSLSPVPGTTGPRNGVARMRTRRCLHRSPVHASCTVLGCARILPWQRPVGSVNCFVWPRHDGYRIRFAKSPIRHHERSAFCNLNPLGDSWRWHRQGWQCWQCRWRLPFDALGRLGHALGTSLSIVRRTHLLRQHLSFLSQQPQDLQILFQVIRVLLSSISCDCFNITPGVLCKNPDQGRSAKSKFQRKGFQLFSVLQSTNHILHLWIWPSTCIGLGMSPRKHVTWKFGANRFQAVSKPDPSTTMFLIREPRHHKLSRSTWTSRLREQQTLDLFMSLEFKLEMKKSVRITINVQNLFHKIRPSRHRGIVQSSVAHNVSDLEQVWVMHSIFLHLSEVRFSAIHM